MEQRVIFIAFDDGVPCFRAFYLRPNFVSFFTMFMEATPTAMHLPQATIDMFVNGGC